MQNKKLVLIHVAKKQLGLDDAAYRAILSGAGVTSSKDIKTEAQFNTVMGAFKQLGFNSTWIGRRINTVAGTPGMISRRQEYYIKGLWALASRVKDDKSLRRIIKRIGKVDDISFLPRRSASAVILALRDICWKAGYNPDKEGEPDVYNSKGSCANIAHETSQSALPADDGGDRSGQNQRPRHGPAGSLAAFGGCGK